MNESKVEVFKIEVTEYPNIGFCDPKADYIDKSTTSKVDVVRLSDYNKLKLKLETLLNDKNFDKYLRENIGLLDPIKLKEDFPDTYALIYKIFEFNQIQKKEFIQKLKERLSYAKAEAPVILETIALAKKELL